MNERWSRAEERYRQRTEELRYRRVDERAARGRGAHRAPVDDWDEYGEWAEWEDDTTVIPRYTDDDSEPIELARPAAPRTGPQRAARGQRERTDAEARQERRRAQAGRSKQSARAKQGRPKQSERTDQSARQGKRRPREESGRKSGSRSRRSSRIASRKAAERKRRRRNMMVVGCVFLVLFVAAAGYAGYKLVGKLSGPEDFAGPGGPLVVVQVHSGDTAEQISQTLVDKGVVKSSGAFYQAAVRSSRIKDVQPGFYQVPSHSKGSDALTALVAKDSRVGNVVISEGRRLHDSTDVHTGARNEGIYRKIADASCMGTGDTKKCATYEQLDAAGASPDLAGLGVPAWAMDGVKAVPDRSRQLEGLISAGAWDFDPSGTPAQILHQLISESAASYETTGLQQPSSTNLTPYQTLVGASLVEREALAQDMPRVARVIVNRLAASQPLQFDSTVNYTLDRTEVATTDADRQRPTPWNTYAMPGLPATPISSPSLDALRAMENPTPGPWLYFVTVDKQGTTMFTDSYSEHLRNIQKARQSGILDSGRDSGR